MYVLLFILKEEIFRWKHGSAEIAYHGIDVFDTSYIYTSFFILILSTFVLSALLVQKTAELLSRAKRPLLLLGSQATLPPASIQSVRRSVEALGVPCFLGGMSRGLLGKNSQLQMRHQRKEALKEADLVILAGTVCDFRLSYGRVLPRGVPVIAVNRDKDQLYRVMTLLKSFDSASLNNNVQANL